MSPQEIEAIQSQNEVAILCGCAECGRRVTEGPYNTPREGVALIERAPDMEFSPIFPLCRECVQSLVTGEVS